MPSVNVGDASVLQIDNGDAHRTVRVIDDRT